MKVSRLYRLSHVQNAGEGQEVVNDEYFGLTTKIQTLLSMRIPELERDVKGLQTLLKQFGASMRGNVSEFEKWQETFNAAADNSLKNAKEYGLSMFLQYNLLGSLE